MTGKLIGARDASPTASGLKLPNQIERMRQQNIDPGGTQLFLPHGNPQQAPQLSRPHSSP